MKVNDFVKVTNLDDEDKGHGIELGTTGVIIEEDFYNIENDADDVFFVKLNCNIIGFPSNLNNDGSYQLYRRQLELL